MHSCMNAWMGFGIHPQTCHIVSVENGSFMNLSTDSIHLSLSEQCSRLMGDLLFCKTVFCFFKNSVRSSAKLVKSASSVSQHGKADHLDVVCSMYLYQDGFCFLGIAECKTIRTGHAWKGTCSG